MISQRVLRFIIAGGIAAGANFCSRIALAKIMGYVPSILIAYCIGMVTAFVLNRLFVFKDAANPIHHQIGWFIIVNLAAIAQTVIISVGLADYVLPALGGRSHVETIAHGIGVVFPVITSYIGHKHLSFRDHASTG